MYAMEPITWCHQARESGDHGARAMEPGPSSMHMVPWSQFDGAIKRTHGSHQARIRAVPSSQGHRSAVPSSQDPIFVKQGTVPLGTFIIRIWVAESILVTVRDDATLCEWLSDVWELRGV